jgi:hypothetical protein
VVPKVMLLNCRLLIGLDALWRNPSRVHRFTFTGTADVPVCVPVMTELQLSVPYQVLPVTLQDSDPQCLHLFLDQFDVPEVAKRFRDTVTIEALTGRDLTVSGLQCKHLHLKPCIHGLHKLWIDQCQRLESLALQGAHLLNFQDLSGLRHLCLYDSSVNHGYESIARMEWLETIDIRCSTVTTVTLMLRHKRCLQKVIYESSWDSVCFIEHNPVLTEVCIGSQTHVLSVQNNPMLKFIGVIGEASPFYHQDETSHRIQVFDKPVYACLVTSRSGPFRKNYL